jgi:hypothetical protein
LVGYDLSKNTAFGCNTVSRGELEVVEYVPRQAITANVGPPDHNSKSEDLWSRIRFEHRTLTSCAAALVAVTLHILLVAPAFWGGGSAKHAPESYHGETAMQWVVLIESPDASAVNQPTLPSPALQAISLTGALPTPPLNSLAAGPSASHQADGEWGLGMMYGRYVGQIRARIERAWQRPRTAIGAPLFQCQVQVDQDAQGRVQDATLVECNGDTRWRLSLVHAIEVASPLPAPPNPAVFAPHILLEFRAMAYSPGAQAELYEPPNLPAMSANSGAGQTQSQNAFHALRDAARAPDARKVVELRIEGSKAEVEPERK